DLKVTGAAYRGTLDQSASAITGEWVQRGKTVSLDFKRYDPSKVARAAVPKDLEGIWLGALKLNGGIELRLGLKVEQRKTDGTLKAVLVSPDQGADNIAVSSIDVQDGVLTFESKGLGVKYTGKKNKDGTAFDGQFVQQGVKLPLSLKRTNAI